MNDQPRQTDSHLEDLLRHWGRQEALRQADESLPPMRAPRKRVALPTLLAAAAVVLVCAVLGSIVLPSFIPPGGRARTPAPEAQLLEKNIQETATLREALRRTQAHVAEMTQRLADAEAARSKDVQTATAEMQRLRADLDTTRQDLSAADAELAALTARDERLFADLQAVYLAAAAPGLHGLEARQAAAREHRMLARLVALRSVAPDAQTGQLLDRLEVLLTHLELLEPGDPRATQGFDDVIALSDVARRIDDALGTVTQADLRAWLVEARIILAGVEHAG